MAFWLASAASGQETDWIQRFDPRFWTVDFPRPMMASATTTAPDALRIDASFLTLGDLAGIIWDSADTLDHPLLAYTTDRDYTRTTLSFHWKSSGVLALDAVNGPTLTIEGRDATGAARSWYVRLWNYASGSNTDAQITLPFSSIGGGWDASDALYAADIDRMFISLAAPGYVAGSTTALATPVDGWVEMTGVACTGDRAMIEIGNVFVPPHGAAMATAYDDCYNQTPARLIRTIRQLGYRGSVLHYVGMSHFPRLVANGAAFQVAADGAVLCAPASAWHAAFFAQCVAAGLSPIASLSYEVLAQYCPNGWQQKASDGTIALTGWSPPSTLLSPANTAAMAWQQKAAAAFAGLMVAAGCALRFQIG
ncbi:MAG TPA: TIGR02217 family protein, partial [Novosphingobium sp.]|nr:TIGR02217 family protein [Novosphingobium sp.]